MSDEIPEPPVIRTSELWGRNTPYALLPSARHSVGWLQTSDDTAIPLEERARFVTIRRSAMGGYKVVSTYPLTKDGWQQACQELAALEPSAIPMLHKLDNQDCWRQFEQMGPKSGHKLNTQLFDQTRYLEEDILKNFSAYKLRPTWQPPTPKDH